MWSSFREAGANGIGRWATILQTHTFHTWIPLSGLPFPLSLLWMLVRLSVPADVSIGLSIAQRQYTSFEIDKRRVSTIRDFGKYATTTRAYTRLRVYQLLPATTHKALSC